MDNEAFTRAIDNGLGRAILWLRQHPWRPYEEAITHVCLHTTAFDPQCEGSRAEYVHEIIGLTDAPQVFAERSIEALLASKDYWDTDHLYNLARRFAQDGNTAARDAIYAKFKQNHAPERFPGADQIVRLDGTKGLLFVLDWIGQRLHTNPDYWVDDALLSEAQDILGDTVPVAVANAAQTTPNIGRYVAAQEQWKRECKNQRSQSPEWKHLTYAELRHQIIENPSGVPHGWLLSWGRNATEEGLREAAADVQRETVPTRLFAYLRIFALRTFPGLPQRLVKLSTSQDTKVATAARRALRFIHHDDVRGLATKLIQQGKADSDVVALLTRNFSAGDERTIESLLVTQTDEDELHWLCHAAVTVFEGNATAEVLSPLLQVYERCRCSNCRAAAIKVLIARDVIPEWLVEECRFDSNEDIRKMMVTQGTKGGQPPPAS